MNKKKRVIISGAGIAGLTCAIWLGINGFNPIIIEKSPSIRAHGYIVSLSHESFRLASELGILEKLCNRGAGIKESCYYDKNKTPMLSLDYQNLFAGLDIVQIMRDELETVLYEEAKDLCEFRFDNSLTKIDQDQNKVYIELKDGTADTCDVLIGADGLHSVTRSLTFTESEVEKRYMGIFSSAYRLPNVLGISNRFENHMEQKRYMCVYTTGANDLACVFIWKSNALEAPKSKVRVSVLSDAFEGSSDATMEVISNAPGGESIYMDPLIQIRMQSWNKGNVVLLGDAAHCLTLLSGQGASTAFWGASVLAKQLIENNADIAFDRYHSVLSQVTDKMQQTTRNAAKWYIPDNRLNYLSRDFAMRYLPNSFFQYYFKNKYSKA